jgi:nitrogen-specific signal transduction histidine kinase
MQNFASATANPSWRYSLRLPGAAMVGHAFLSPLSHLDPAHILDALPASVLVLDHELCLVYANAEAQTLLGLSFNRVRGRPLAELLRDPQSVVGALHAALEQQSAVSWTNVGLKATPVPGSATAEAIHLQANPFEDDMTGVHLIVKLSRAGRAPVRRAPRSRLRGSARVAPAAIAALPADVLHTTDLNNHDTDPLDPAT